MRYANIDIPDLPLAAFRKDVRGQVRPQGGKGGGTPDVPDYTALAQQQAQSNLDLAKYATQANRVNQFTPYGSITWSNDRTFDQAGYDAAMRAYKSGGATNPSNFSYTGRDQAYARAFGDPVYRDGQWGWIDPGGGDSATPTFIAMHHQPGGGPGSIGGAAAPNPADFYSSGDQWTQNMQFSPEVQAVYDRAIQGLGQQYGDALAAYDPTTATNQATDLILSRVNPELDRQAETLRSQLTNQGIAQGSAAWNRAMSQFGQQRNDAVTQAQLQGIGLGMNQQSQAFNQASYLRGLPLNELNTLLGGGQLQSASFPGYAQQATTAGPDLTGAAQAGYNAELGAYNAQQAQNSGLFGGLGGLIGAGIGYLNPVSGLSSLASAGLGSAVGSGVGGGLGGLFSDVRLKTNIRRIGTADNGLPIYSYRYIWGGPTHIGHMADEVEELYPDAVSTVEGYKTVDYSKVH